MNTNQELSIYTDGSFSSSLNRGGWSVYIPELQYRICNNESNTTVNRMELTAIKNALAFIYDTNIDRKVCIYSDSMYVIGGLTLSNWSISTNSDLWNEVNAYKQLLKDKDVSFIHIKGHAGIDGNETADKLAVKASQNNL